MQDFKTTAWQEQFGWIWYNDAEIFDLTDDQLDAKVKVYADAGITTLIGFTSTHFRFNYMEHLDVIHACIKKLVDACHKYGMRYVEHHSSTLYYAPNCDEEWEYFYNQAKQKDQRFENWPGYLEGVSGDPIVGGFHLSELSQIDGETGELATSPYACRVMCHSNPHYAKIYGDYLDQVYALGVDGIMTDDIQNHFRLSDRKVNACTCQYCREAFRKEYGYELPEPKDWAVFEKNFDDPVYVAWLQFRLDNKERFIRYLTDRCKAKGYNLIRPNYISTIVHGNPTSNSFETCADLWDVVFQENYTGSIISASFPTYAIEAHHRNAMAENNDYPSMSMFYPASESSVYFSWALSKAWGQLYMQTSDDGLNFDYVEAKYRAFETKHMDFLTKPKKYTDVSFLHSMLTRENTTKGYGDYIPHFMSWLQGAYMSGLGTGMVFETDSQERLDANRVIVCVDTAMLSEETVARLASYVAQGGTLVIVGDFAIVDPSAKVRPAEALHAAFGDWEQLCRTGRILCLPASAGCKLMQNGVTTDRFRRMTDWVKSAPYVIDQQRATVGATLQKIIGRKKVDCVCTSDVLASAFDTDAGVAVHLVNITDVLAKNGEEISHFAPVKPFAEGAEPCEECVLSIETGRAIISAVAYTPEQQNGVELPVTTVDGRVEFTVPKGVFSGYCLVELR